MVVAAVAAAGAVGADAAAGQADLVVRAEAALAAPGGGRPGGGPGGGGPGGFGAAVARLRTAQGKEVRVVTDIS